jgi:hypothetical protein
MAPRRSSSSSVASLALELPGDLRARCAQDDWREHLDHEAAALAEHPPAPHNLFAEFRRKLAGGETLSRALARLAEALRFTGRITISFHQGRVTKTILEESFLGGAPGQAKS